MYFGLCFKYLERINKLHLPRKVKGPNMAGGVLLNSEYLLSFLG